MTDHQKLLVTLLSEPDVDFDGPVSTPAVMAMLYELGDDGLRPIRSPIVRLSAPLRISA